MEKLFIAINHRDNFRWLDKDFWSPFTAWAIDTEGSSRSSALIRIGLVLIIWARYAAEQLPLEQDFGSRTVFSLAFFLFTTTMLVGYKTRISTLIVAILLLSIYYYFGLILGGDYAYHHTYWLAIATLLCALTPCGKSYSLDRWQAIQYSRQTNQSLPLEKGNLWGLRLMVVQLTMMYFWTAVNKLRPEFANGDRLEAIFMTYYSNTLDVDYWSWAFVAMAWLVLLLEFALAFGMPFRQTRKYLVIPGLVLHAAFYIFLPVYTYSITIMLLYLAYYDADRVHQVIDELSGLTQAPPIARANDSPGVADGERRRDFLCATSIEEENVN